MVKNAEGKEKNSVSASYSVDFRLLVLLFLPSFEVNNLPINYLGKTECSLLSTQTGRTLKWQICCSNGINNLMLTGRTFENELQKTVGIFNGSKIRTFIPNYTFLLIFILYITTYNYKRFIEFSEKIYLKVFISLVKHFYCNNSFRQYMSPMRYQTKVL